jgi:hypothetical protein
MSSRSYPGLFETTHAALLLPSAAAGAGTPLQVDPVDLRKLNLDKNFWILRELGRCVVHVDPAAGPLDLSRRPAGIVM